MKPINVSTSQLAKCEAINIDNITMRTALKAVHSCLKAVVAASGGHIE